jgi:hypothetical protein
MLRQKASLMPLVFSLATLLAAALIVSVVVPGFGGGAGSAQAASLPYLSEALNQEAKMSVAELAAIRVTAYYNCPGALTTRLVRQSARCFLGPTSIDLFVDTRTQPEWDTHLGAARFSVSDAEVAAAYGEAGAVATEWLTRFFPGVAPGSMRVIFTVKGYQIGIYSTGRFTIVR